MAVLKKNSEWWIERFIFLVTILLMTITAFTYSEATSEGRTHIVERVIDGNTLKLTDGEKVRLIGIDSPESKPNNKAKRGSKRIGQDVETVPKIGQGATEYVDKLLRQDGYRIYKMEYDVQERDTYGRLLAYVYIFIQQRGVTKDDRGNCVEWTSPDMHLVVDDDCVKLNFLNATLIKAGHATPVTIPPNVKYSDLFKRLYEEAREQGKELRKEEIPSKPVACTMEAKICPDGSAVGRVGPNCEFKECPE